MCRDDVETITANPKTAGVARWNFLALWGAHMARGHQAALDYTTKACRPAGIYSPLLPFLFHVLSRKRNPPNSLLPHYLDEDRSTPLVRLHAHRQLANQTDQLLRRFSLKICRLSECGTGVEVQCRQKDQQQENL